ncbi:tRNA lysidine(34) synthetase TilS, partial [Streptomyces bauhiniae]|nr:tRNA lysidine(34) synthetase TilS [Streptomyces bauhiniae]
MGPHPAVAAIRLAVRRVLHDIATGQAAEPGSTAHGSGGHGAVAVAHRTGGPSTAQR